MPIRRYTIYITRARACEDIFQQTIDYFKIPCYNLTAKQSNIRGIFLRNFSQYYYQA